MGRLRAVFFGVVFRCRFGCVGTPLSGFAAVSCTASASGSGDMWPLRVCLLRYVGNFSQGRTSWTTCRRRIVVSRAASGWVRGMPCFVRYERLSNPCRLRWRRDNCLKAWPHSRQVTVCLVILFRQSTGTVSETGAGAKTALR